MRQILKILLILWLVANVVLAGENAHAADVASYNVVKEKSFIKFIAIQNGAPIEGKFKDFNADIKFDHENLIESGVTVEVNTGSVEVSNPDVQGSIKLPEWLGTEAFPKATFICKKFTRMPGSENYYADGKLTLHGKSAPVVINFQMTHFDGNTAIATGYLSLRRFDYDVGQGEWSRDDVIKNEVRVEFRIVAEKVQK